MVLPQAMAWVQYWFRVLSLKFCGKSKKKLRGYIPAIPRFLHVWPKRKQHISKRGFPKTIKAKSSKLVLPGFRPKSHRILHMTAPPSRQYKKKMQPNILKVKKFNKKSCPLLSPSLNACYSNFDFCMDHFSPSKQQRNIVQLCTKWDPD